MKNLLDGKMALQHSITVYVPTTWGEYLDSPDNVKQTCDYVASQLAKYHGGFTITRGKGGWISEEDGELVQEDVYMIRANCAELNDVETNHAVRLAEYVKDIHKQEAVSLEIDGTLYLI